MPKKSNRIPGVEKRGDKWRARAFFGGHEYAKTFPTQEEAVRWKREQERALQRGDWIDPNLSSITFKEWSEKWLLAKTNIAPCTLRGYKLRLKVHLIPEFGNKKLTSITHNEIGQWISRSLATGNGAVVIRQSFGVLRQILNSAVLDGRLNRNPAIGVSLPKLRKSEKKPLTLAQLRALAGECEGFESLILFAGTTGLRWGEIAALQCKDISLLHRTVYVGKAISDGPNGEKVVSSTKTHQSRTVPFPKELTPRLELLISNRGPEAHLFTMPATGVLEYNNFMTRVFRPAVKRCNFEGLTFHNLRHTTASLLISQGTPITTVAGILGHASTQMTLDTYGHLYEDDASKHMDRLGERLFGVGTDKERTKLISVHSKLSV